jgi:polyhydroxybutyrate depolymerase
VTDATVDEPSNDDAGSHDAPATKDCNALKPFDGPQQVQVGARTREYLLHVSSKPGTGPRPLVLDLHGLLTHAAYQRATTGFATVADAEGFVVAYPQAIDGAWSFGADTCCAVDSSVDDVAFIQALVEELAKTGCIDAKRVYAVGVSAGGGLAQQLACRAADVFAAVASRDFDLLVSVATSCRPARPIALLSLRDAASRDVPYAAGTFRPISGLNAQFESRGAAASFQRWAELNRCAGNPEARDADCQAYASCDAGVEVELCTRAEGNATDDAMAQWEFLRRFQLP